MFAPVPEVDLNDEGKTPPPLLMLIELGHTAADWIVTYHFYLGELDGHFTMHLAPVGSLTPDEALEKAKDKQSPLLARARLALLQAVNLETVN